MKILKLSISTPIQLKTSSSEMSNASRTRIFDYVNTFVNEPVTVHCCHQNNTADLATCGMGTSCEGSCSAIGASLCPVGSREEPEPNRIASWQLNWCLPACNVWKSPICCHHPVCIRREAQYCYCWENFLKYQRWEKTWPNRIFRFPDIHWQWNFNNLMKIRM